MRKIWVLRACRTLFFRDTLYLCYKTTTDCLLFSLNVACISPASPPGPAPPVPRRYIILVRPRGDLPLWLFIFIRIYGMEGIKRRLAEGVHLFDFIELDLT